MVSYRLFTLIENIITIQSYTVIYKNRRIRMGKKKFNATIMVSCSNPECPWYRVISIQDRNSFKQTYVSCPKCDSKLEYGGTY